MDEREDLVSLVLKNEVTSVEKMELEIPQVSLIGMRTSLGEYEIVLAPDDECRRCLSRNQACTLGYRGKLFR